MDSKPTVKELNDILDGPPKPFMLMLNGELKNIPEGYTIIRQSIAHEGKDYNGYFWNRDALLDMVKTVNTAAQEGHPIQVMYKFFGEDKGENGSVGFIVDTALMSDGSMEAVLAINIECMKSYGIEEKDIATINFGHCTEINYRLDCVASFPDKSYGPLTTYEPFPLKMGDKINADSPGASNLLVLVNGVKQGYVNKIMHTEEGVVDIRLRLPIDSVKVYRRKD